MKAALCTHYGPPEEMEVRDVPSPVPGKNQVLISVKACGVNFPDVLMLGAGMNAVAAIASLALLKPMRRTHQARSAQ